MAGVQCVKCGKTTSLFVGGVAICYDCYQAGFVPVAAKPKAKRTPKAKAKKE